MIIGIPVYDGVDLLDVTVPHEIFTWMNRPERPVDVRLISETGHGITSRDGFTFAAPRKFSDDKALDVLWVPGGDPPALKKLMSGPDRTFLDFLIARSQNARFVCSVCEGALLLAAAGLL